MSKKQFTQEPVHQEPRRFNRSQKEFIIDVFKSDEKIHTQNDSFRSTEFKPNEKKHIHWFRTFDSQGRKHKRVAMASGHTHEIVEVKTGADGVLTLVTGPAIIEKHIPNGDGTTYTEWHPVEHSFKKDNRWAKFVDDHTHEWEYMGSDAFSQEKAREIQQSNATAIAQLRPKAQSTQPEPPTAA